MAESARRRPEKGARSCGRRAGEFAGSIATSAKRSHCPGATEKSQADQRLKIDRATRPRDAVAARERFGRGGDGMCKTTWKGHEKKVWKKCEKIEKN
jgi:hypothetical protein